MNISTERKTWFAEPDRISRGEIVESNRNLLDHPLLRPILSYAPSFVGVLNRFRQFVLLNDEYIENLGLGLHGSRDALSMRPGEILGCIHSGEMPAGCGTASACRYCTLVHTVLEAFRTGKRVDRDVRLTVETPEGIQGLEFRVRVQPVSIGEETVAILFMHDIGTMKRKEMLERIFFHDVLNSATILGNLGSIIRSGSLGEEGLETYLPLFESALQEVVDQIQYHRKLASAESGDLHPTIEHFRLDREIEEQVRNMKARNAVGESTVHIDADLCDVTIASDRILVRRIILNMLKNAVEAGPAPRTIAVNLRPSQDRVQVEVRNPETIPPEILSQIFQHSFSTRGRGRGLGTYSMKLLSTRYLGGDVTVTSDASGTAFVLDLPREPISP